MDWAMTGDLTGWPDCVWMRTAVCPTVSELLGLELTLTCRLTNQASLGEFSCSVGAGQEIHPRKELRHEISPHGVVVDPRASTRLHLEESRDGDRGRLSWRVCHLELGR